MVIGCSAYCTLISYLTLLQHHPRRHSCLSPFLPSPSIHLPLLSIVLFILFILFLFPISRLIPSHLICVISIIPFIITLTCFHPYTILILLT
ncbi:hypothetical protein BJX99DRAFT_80660 [Aspergillus californicus]